MLTSLGEHPRRDAVTVADGNMANGCANRHVFVDFGANCDSHVDSPIVSVGCPVRPARFPLDNPTVSQPGLNVNIKYQQHVNPRRYWFSRPYANNYIWRVIPVSKFTYVAF